MIRRIYKILVGLSVLVLVLKLANWAVKHEHPLPAPPHPNGYDEMVAAAGLLQPLPHDLSELGSEQILQLAAQNRPALERARKGFQMESRVPLQPTKAWDDQHTEDLAGLKHLAVAFGIESRAQLLQGQTNKAARCDMDALRLAQAVQRGGLLIDGVTSLAVETIGLALLQGKISQMDAAGCRESALALEDLAAKREPPETTIASEKNWSAARFGLLDLAGGFVMRKDLAKRQAQFVIRSHEAADKMQRLMLRLAARAYELDHQQPPANVAALIPSYLKSIPHDRETGGEIQEIPPLVK